MKRPFRAHFQKKLGSSVLPNRVAVPLPGLAALAVAAVLPVLVAGLMFLAGCTKIEQPPVKKLAADALPTLEYKDSVVVHMYDKSEFLWELRTTYMNRDEQTKRLFAKPVSLVFYDSLGQPSAEVTSDSGAADENITFVNVWGNVYALTDDSLVVEADSMMWKKATKQIRTDGWVKVITPEKDTLTGVGFTSDDQLKNWKILSNIRTVIQRVDERLQESKGEEKE